MYYSMCRIKRNITKATPVEEIMKRHTVLLVAEVGEKPEELEE